MSLDPEVHRMATAAEQQPLIPATNESVSHKNPSLWEDAKDTVVLAAPIFMSSLSFVGMKTTDSALLGHVSAQALSAAALSDLWTMCTQVLIGARILTVLASSAVGAGNPKLAGIYYQVSLLVLSFVALFVFVCWMATEQVWLAWGTAPDLAAMAGYYACVLAWSLPGQLLVGQLSQIFTSQRIMHPTVNSSALAMILNLLGGLVCVLGVWVPGWHGWGFAACPIVTVSAVYVQVLVLYGVYVGRQRLHEPCWDGWSWPDLTTARIQTFLQLYIPAALGTASDFWRVAVIGTMAARLGLLQVAVFNTGYRIMWIVLTMIGALSSAASVKTSQRLGELNHVGAKQAAWVGIYMSCTLLFCVGGWVVVAIQWLGRIFTDDDDFLEQLEQVRWPFTTTLILMNLSVAIERIPFSMGRTKEVFWYGFVASWGAQVPGVYLATRYWRNDLVGLYVGMTCGYLVLTILYGWIVIHCDWKHYATEARERSEMTRK